VKGILSVYRCTCSIVCL